MDKSPMLEIKQLSYAFPSETGVKPIFRKISLDVKAGEFVSVIGASGSGKSTLFKLISGLLQPDEGQIWIGGQQVQQQLGEVALMPQKDLLLPWRTVIENVQLPLEIAKIRSVSKTAEIKKWLSRFGLEDVEKAYPHELSGGMRQRVAFLRTLMTNRQVLLLDEPFGALDSLTKRKMHSWLLGLWGDLQKTVLFITHDLEEALLLSDRIYLLTDDCDETVKEVTVNLPRPRNAELIYQANFIELRRELELRIHDA